MKSQGIVRKFTYKNLPKKYRDQIKIYWSGRKPLAGELVYKKVAIYLLLDNLQDKVLAYAIVSEGNGVMLLEELESLIKVGKLQVERDLYQILTKRVAVSGLPFVVPIESKKIEKVCA